MKQSDYTAALKRHTAALTAAHRARTDNVAQSARVSDVLEYLRAGDTLGLARHLMPASLDEHLRAVYVAGGNDEAASLPAWAAAGQRDARRTVFDPSHPAAVEWLARATAQVQADDQSRHRQAVIGTVRDGKEKDMSHRWIAERLIGMRGARTGKRMGGAIHVGMSTATLAHTFYNAGRKHLHEQAIQQGVDAARALRTYRARGTLDVRDAAPEAEDGTEPPDEGSVDLRIFSALIEHSIDLLRVEAGINLGVQQILTEMEAELIAKLTDGGMTTFAQERLEGMLAESRMLIETRYNEAQRGVDLHDLASMETNFTGRMLAREIGVKLAQGIVPEVVLRSLVGNLLIQGAPSAEWWAQQSADTAFRFANAVRQGVAQGETVQQMVKRVQTSEKKAAATPGAEPAAPGRIKPAAPSPAPRAAAPAKPVLDTARRNVESLVRTSVATVTNAARAETYKQNDDVVLGTRQISTLDGRTSLVCIAYSGATWDLDKKPLAPNKLLYNGGCPRHWGCRSVEAPIIRELAPGIGEFRVEQRAAAGGPVSTKLSFAQWLETKPVSFQNELLGEGRAELWRRGDITLAQLLDMQGRPLTVAQLRAKYVDGSGN